jgi:hypothetical protein
VIAFGIDFAVSVVSYVLSTDGAGKNVTKILRTITKCVIRALLLAICWVAVALIHSEKRELTTHAVFTERLERSFTIRRVAQKHLHPRYGYICTK